MSVDLRMFRPVPRTGVIYVMTEAEGRGFEYGHPGWANLGQGAPETGPIRGSAPRLEQLRVDERTSEYAPVAGLMALRQAIADLYNARYRRGQSSKYAAQNVAIAAGGRQALTRIASALGNINLGHLLPDYTAYEELLEVFRAFVPIPIPLAASDGFRLSPKRLRDTIMGDGLGAILFSNPCNPTGRVIAGADLHACVETARDLGCALILDEFYAHYVYDREPGEGVSAAAHVGDVDRDPVVIVDGLTKNWRYPGLRLSWTLGPSEVIEKIASAGSFLDGGAPHAIQQAAVELVTPEMARMETEAIQARFGPKRDLMRDRLEAMGIGVEAPEGAFYCWADLAGLPTDLQDGMDFFQAALDHQVVCVPGVFFDVDPGGRRGHIPSRLRNYVRLSYGPDVDELELGLTRIGQMIVQADG